MAYRVSITGIDGSGKSTCAYNVFKRLSEKYKVALISRVGLINDSKENITSNFFLNLSYMIENLQNFADSLETKVGVALVNAFDSVFIWPFKESLIKDHSPEIILCPRDRILDPAVYMTFYLPKTRKLSAKERLGLAKKIADSNYPSLFVYLHLPVQLAYERIKQRIEMDKDLQIHHKIKRRMHMHENIKDLEILQNYFLDSINLLRKNGNDVYVVDATNNEEKVALDISNYILDKVANKYQKL
jgi:thymidylate kinase